jgi:hypothetical protein
MEDERATTVSRRDLIKKSAIVGGVIWATPMVMAGPAGAAGALGCPNCPDGMLYGLKNDTSNGTNITTVGGGATCVVVPAGGVKDAECLYNAGLITISASGSTTTFVLSPGIEYCQAAAKGAQNAPGGPCAQSNAAVQEDTPSAGFTTIVVTHPTLSHTELIVCVTGSLPSECL